MRFHVLRTHILFGAAYRESEYPEQAAEEFRRAVALNPDYPRVHYYLGLSYLSQEGRSKSSEAIAEFNEELRRHPREYLAEYLLGLVYVQERKLEEAVPHLERAIELQPERRKAATAIASDLFLCDDYDGGNAVLQVETDAAWRADTLTQLAREAIPQTAYGQQLDYKSNFLQQSGKFKSY